MTSFSLTTGALTTNATILFTPSHRIRWLYVIPRFVDPQFNHFKLMLTCTFVSRHRMLCRRERLLEHSLYPAFPSSETARTATCTVLSPSPPIEQFKPSTLESTPAAAASQCARSPIQSVGRSVPSLRSSALKMDGILHAVEATALSV